MACIQQSEENEEKSQGAGAQGHEFLSVLYALGARDHGASIARHHPPADADAVRLCIARVDRRAKLHGLVILWPVCRPAALALVPVLLAVSALQGAPLFVALAARIGHCGLNIYFPSVADRCLPPLHLVALGAWCGLAWWWIRCMVRGRERHTYTPGVFYNGSGVRGRRMEAILERAAFLRPLRQGSGGAASDVYTAPPWYLGGDWATVAAGLVADDTQPMRRLRFPLEEGKHVILDVFGLARDSATAMPAKGQNAGGGRQLVFLVVPGIGSDSSFPPAQDLARRTRVEGSICVVVNPMGLKADVQASVTSVHDVSRVDLLHSAVVAVCTAAAPAPVVLAGYSLGGISLASYLARCAAPHNVVGCICVSGALKTDFISSSHYMRYYQPLIVCGLVRDLLVKYGADMLAIMGARGLASLARAHSYFDLQQRFYGSLPFPPRARRLYCWWAAVESWSWRQCINIPLVIVTALDDPLHRSSIPTPSPPALTLTSHSKTLNSAFWPCVGHCCERSPSKRNPAF
jgi:predicted alpha/beta-fold hydrolase